MSPAMNSRSSTGCGRPALASQVVAEVRSVLTGKLPNLHERGHRRVIAHPHTLGTFEEFLEATSACRRSLR